jgi:hypothetical protein
MMDVGCGDVLSWIGPSRIDKGRRSTGSGEMIRYSCDLCKRELDPHDDLRYVVKVEVYAAFDPAVADADGDDRDHLEEIQDILERIEDASESEIGDEIYQQLRFDLCPDCRKRFLENPLGRETAKAFGFSPN